jgi:hypothetical protein
MSRSHLILTSTIALGALLLSTAGTAEAAMTITCESRNNARHSCPVNTSDGVRLSRQLSTQGCWQNDTWGYGNNEIWVTNGCRAEFAVGGQKSSSSSSSSAIAAAAVVGLAAAAVIANNNDDHHNNKHKNDNYYNDNYYNDSYNHRYDYDYDNDNRYRNYDDPNWNYNNSRYGYNGYGGNPRNTFTCESHGGKTNYCTMPKRGHVEVYKQLSSNRCTHGRSWGVEGNRVWVDEGCRAEFAVY